MGIDAANMLMVGDSRNDIIAAKAAGCLSVGVTFGYGDMTLLSQDDTTRPDRIIGALPEIYENLRPQKNKDEE
ncbi:HAD hydrolase-like protein [Neisseria gonorrhoeae]